MIASRATAACPSHRTRLEKDGDGKGLSERTVGNRAEFEGKASPVRPENEEAPLPEQGRTQPALDATGRNNGTNDCSSDQSNT
jgi:hypothetical protein